MDLFQGCSIRSFFYDFNRFFEKFWLFQNRHTESYLEERAQRLLTAVALQVGVSTDGSQQVLVLLFQPARSGHFGRQVSRRHRGIHLC